MKTIHPLNGKLVIPNISCIRYVVSETTSFLLTILAAADVLETVSKPISEIEPIMFAKLAAIAFIRTFLAYFLSIELKELREYEENDEDKEKHQKENKAISHEKTK